MIGRPIRPMILKRRGLHIRFLLFGLTDGHNMSVH